MLVRWHLYIESGPWLLLMFGHLRAHWRLNLCATFYIHLASCVCQVFHHWEMSIPLYGGIQLTHLTNPIMLGTNIPQRTIFVTDLHTCTFLSQNGAFWDMRLVNSGICATGLLALCLLVYLALTKVSHHCICATWLICNWYVYWVQCLPAVQVFRNVL